MTIFAKRILGGCLLLLALLQAALFALNDQARKSGGHDLRPLLTTSILFAIAGLGLVIDARWAKLFSSALLAAWGLWIALRDVFILAMPDPLVGILFGVLSFLPLVFTLRSRSIPAGA